MKLRSEKGLLLLLSIIIIGIIIGVDNAIVHDNNKFGDLVCCKKTVKRKKKNLLFQWLIFEGSFRSNEWTLKCRLELSTSLATLLHCISSTMLMSQTENMLAVYTVRTI